MKSYTDKIQKFGRSLLLPIGVMAPIGMILGITGAFVQSYMIAKFPVLGNPVINVTLKSLRTIAGTVFDNIPLLFAMGVAYGLSKKDKGIAVFASVLSYLVLIVSMSVCLQVSGNMADSAVMSQMGQIKILGIQTLNINAMGGILAGAIAAWATDKFYNLELPIAFAFFAGKKSVSIICMGIMVVIGVVLPFIWQHFVTGLTGLSVVFLSKFGPFFTAGGERLFIPFGLHHLWNALFRFTEAGGSYVIDGTTFVGVVPTMGEILFKQGPDSQYWSLMPKLTRFIAQQQMLCTMFAFPAIALAMYKTAYKENKKMVKGLMITCVVTALLGNVTEPLEFSFVFLSPVLYAIYACIIGLGAVCLSLANVAIGYIRGTIFDFVIFGLLYKGTNWLYFIIIGLCLSVVTYFIFKWFILKFDIKTPGREEAILTTNELIKEKRYGEIAKIVIEGLGGKGNIKNVDNCITRLRIDLVDSKLVDQKILEKSGYTGIFFPMANHIHLVYGPLVEFVRNAVDDELKK